MKLTISDFEKWFQEQEYIEYSYLHYKYIKGEMEKAFNDGLTLGILKTINKKKKNNE
jgi:hypothetical protein